MDSVTVIGEKGIGTRLDIDWQPKRSLQSFVRIQNGENNSPRVCDRVARRRDSKEVHGEVIRYLSGIVMTGTFRRSRLVPAAPIQNHDLAHERKEQVS